MFRTFYKLQPAVELANQYKCGVWAEDLPNGKKKFRVATFPRILEYCTKALKPSLYELIGEGCHTRLYFDIEIHQYQQESLNDFVILKNLELLQMEPDLREVYLLNSINEITEDFCRYFLDFFRSTLRNYVHRTLGILITDNEITVLSACRISKLSFHIVCPSIVFDRHNTSLAFYVEDFAYYFVNVIKAEFLSPETDQTRKGHLIRCLCLNQGKAFAIDLAPYGKNQQFRMFGCGKVGKAPLRLIQNETTSLLPPINFNWNFGQMWGDLVNNEKNTIFAQYGVQLNLEETPIHISPGKSVRNSSRRYYSLYTVGVTPKCQFIGERAEPIYYKKGNSSSTSFNSRGSSAVNHRDVPNYETVFNESGQQVTFDDLEDNDSVFCERCEVIQGIPCGDSSAKILKREDQWIVYCFNCQETVLKVIKTFQFQPILVEDQEKVILVDRYLNQGFQDVSLSDTYRVFAIDAPTGSGKSFMLKEWINRDDLFYDNIIFIYSKQGLCRAMSSYFQIPCYLDFTAQDWRTPPNKFVICLNSIIKLPRDIKTTAIILDEGGLTRKDTCAVTILPTLKDVLEKMHDLCSNTGKVILTQHNLSQTDLDYYSNFVPNLMDNQIFSRIFTQLGAKVCSRCSFSILISSIVINCK